ncbi:MAG: sodium:calcium antiporter [Haloferacaceae archaeon]
MAAHQRIVLWTLVLLVAVWIADWGAHHLADPLRKLRRGRGLTGAAGGALLAIITAAPEIGINTVSALRGVSNIGLGNMLGSNIVSIPIIFTIAYVASRRSLTTESGTGDESSAEISGEAGDGPPPDPDRHEAAPGERVLQLEPRTLTVHVLPYLGILFLIAALTVPEPVRGLQSVDGGVMLVAYVVYLSQAVFRGRRSGEATEWTRRELALAGSGVGAVAVGAFFAVRATEQLADLVGIPEIVGGLFITATMSTVPEMFNTWQVVRSGQVTAGTTSVLADNTATVTLGFLPLALVTVPIRDLSFYSLNFLFLAFIPALLAVLIHFGSGGSGLRRRHVLVLDGVYACYLAVMAVVVLNLR